jgi:hypothetical protein
MKPKKSNLRDFLNTVKDKEPVLQDPQDKVEASPPEEE